MYDYRSRDGETDWGGSRDAVERTVAFLNGRIYDVYWFRITRSFLIVQIRSFEESVVWVSGIFKKLLNKTGIICDSDNAACEGFFGRLKNEMFYGRSWIDVSINSFIDEINNYIIW